MNEQNSFERLVADELAGASVGAPPESAIEDTITRAAGTRSLPRWLALMKEPPMRIDSHLTVGSPTARIAAIMLATLLLVAAVAGIGVTGARLLAADGPIVVDQSGSGDYTTLTEAVAAADDGNEILVRPGTYVEALVIDKTVTVRGDGPMDDIVFTAPEGGPTWMTGGLSPEDVGYALVLAANDTALSDISFRGEDSRVFIDGGAPTIEGLAFDDVGKTVDPDSKSPGSLIILGGSRAVIRGNSFTSGSGIGTYEAGPLIVGNVLPDGQFINGLFDPEAEIRDNVLTGVGPMGISLWYDASPLVEGNTITDRGRALVMWDSAEPIIVSNTIAGAMTAMTVSANSHPQIRDNVIEDSEMGIFLEDSDALISGNEIRGNGTGIAVWAGSPTLEGNHVCDNVTNLSVGAVASPIIDESNEICEDAPAE